MPLRRRRALRRWSDGSRVIFLERSGTSEPDPFLALHLAIINSGVAFGSSAFPYCPHCSLKGLTAPGPGQREALSALSVPAAPFTIRTGHTRPSQPFVVPGSIPA